ncbi:bifunctional [glutamate--ammonia ligase]-adenylyl-L-tyrosine phosphorylase/[glutamate--ammonia-ligase] adenylyltransferase [Alteromonas aestuariivivens]|uniref:Bifunctional glutamine synthetase adenylyltransferase/adenylyl-removing enzyme n=1 Tax=Alteromonas aestuariivivens TaxID=1938339 RepID=A0A3D8MF46_9ALTE|nr:bifunctional [glutamate--ammonia ligase]-adenylyl-L-tyrosine phosphorylase/[glutamate--ammonia-ligase] adenylyltransferase [Alteromonas aestuariivivens]RDV29427.1 bifunctional [glutamate--ammonia ligase]-adenylyl-L-tyrosine phosphorylase/[glutamate--ammonia-ligase] adenylyltransferase [Alteromonas aestuariivivens]
MPTLQRNNRIMIERGAQFWQRFCDAMGGHSALLSHSNLLTEVFGLSEFIAEQAIRHPEWVTEIISQGEHLCHNHSSYAEHLRQSLYGIEHENDFHQALRHFRHRHMMSIAWRDLTNVQIIEDSLKQVSELADALILEAYQWLYQRHCEHYGTPVGEHGPLPMLILGMGKLGGRELNFSSDIDLIFSFPAKGHTEGSRKPIENQQFFNRLAQKLISALAKITADGQVFRVDMRLRPFGESGPLTMHFAALEDYYQEQGRHWERFAMVKARIMNPPDAYTEELEDILTPFTFRRYLDFTTIDALRSMKQLIAREIRRRRLADNIKLGAGGIREVEFFAQSFQLIHGGRQPQLRTQSVKATLEALEKLNLIDQATLNTLYADYCYLRKVEHTLQQWRDEQTQTLPDEEWGQEIVFTVCKEPDYTAFYASLHRVMAQIHAQFNQLIEEPQESRGHNDELFVKCRDAWQLGLDESEFTQLMSPPLSEAAAAKCYHQLLAFRQQLRAYRMGERGEETLHKLIPELLYVLTCQLPEQAGQVLGRVLDVVNAVTGRTTYLDLLLENPDVLQQLVKLCHHSGWISEQIQRFPLLLDELLTPLYLQQQNADIFISKQHYQDELRQTLLRIEPEDTELLMDSWRQFKLCQQLRIAASDISGSLPVEAVSDKLTVLAEVVLDSVIHEAWRQVSDRFGIPDHLNTGAQECPAAANTGFAVIGYGKLGGYELGYGSDLDLVFLHNAPRTANTTGSKSVSAQQFYIKLAQRIMHLLNTTTLFGQLYETDLRLRPSGNSGLLCCHIDGFEHYQRHEAWTWEHQALVRARSITGDKALLATFDSIRHQTLRAKRARSELQKDVVSMREKMRAHLLNNKEEGVDLKQCEGGITDIEFLTQYWVLAYADEHPTLTRYSDNLRILDAVGEAGLLPGEEVTQLQQGYLKLRDHYHQLTLAEHKYASDTEVLSQIRQRVSEIWQQVLG